MKLKFSLKEVEKGVKHFNNEEQKQLIIDLPKLLHINSKDINLLRLAEPSFKFWDNPDDAIYDSL